MRRSQRNAYQSARLSAGLSQEAAAEALHVGASTLREYESGVRLPPAMTAAAMSELYRAPWLALEHGKALLSTLRLVPEAESRAELARAAARLVCAVDDFDARRRARQLLRIAGDGVVDEGEDPIFAEILRDLDAIIRAALEVKYAETKKDRPVGGSTKRSRSGANRPANDCIDIISKSRENASPNFAKGGGASR